MAKKIIQNILANKDQGKTYEAIETFISKKDRENRIDYILERFESSKVNVESYNENSRFMLKYTINY